MKKALMTGLAIAALGLATPVFSDNSAASVNADYVNPILAEAKAGQKKHIKYELEAIAYLFFIPVTGKAEFDVILDGPIYQMNTKVKTTGVADIFVDYDMNVAASGYVRDHDLMTYNYVSQNHDGKKNRRVELTYGADDVVMEANPGFSDLGFPPATPEQKLEARDPITGFISAAFRPRAATNPCGEPIKLFDGKQLTHMSFTYVGETNVKTKAYKGKAYECHVKVDRVAGFNEGDKGKNLSGIDGPLRMYFAEPIDGFVTPVKLVVDTDTAIGRITVNAKRIFVHDLDE